MIRFLLSFLICGSILCHAVLYAKTENSKDGSNLQCAVCQFLETARAVNTGIDRTEAVAHCLKAEGCEKQSDCEIVTTLLSGIQNSPQQFESGRAMIEEAVKSCQSDSNIQVINEDASSAQCMLCFLVYDVLKYINYNILENPMLGTVKNAIESACVILNEELCEALFKPDTFGAIIRGLQDSLGGFYDLIAVEGFGCVPYTELFGACPGH